LIFYKKYYIIYIESKKRKEVMIMKRYFIYASEGYYQGLHGINDFGIYLCRSFKEAEETGEELSRQLIQSYNLVEEDYMADELEGIDLDELFFEDRDEFDRLDELMYQLETENVMYDIFEIDEEKGSEFGNVELADKAYYMGVDKFIEEYCVGECHSYAYMGGE
jgi:hypothetical protein